MKAPARILRTLLRDRTYRQLASELGCSATYLNRVVTGKREAGPKLMIALGLERQTRYSVKP
jgi:transcriptional regulator with XRE-family HTH domain